MRNFVILLTMCGLAGCSTGPTLEQLEEQALVTGDWSLVEKREATIARRNLRSGIACPSGYIGYCQTRFASERCTCVEQRVMSTMLSGRR